MSKQDFKLHWKSSMNGGAVDVPVQSWGIFLGVIAGHVQHIILAQNSFCFTDTVFDLDYTSIPVGWTVGIKVLVPANVNRKIADCMIHSFAKSNQDSLARALFHLIS